MLLLTVVAMDVRRCCTSPKTPGERGSRLYGRGADAQVFRVVG